MHGPVLIDAAALMEKVCYRFSSRQIVAVYNSSPKLCCALVASTLYCCFVVFNLPALAKRPQQMYTTVGEVVPTQTYHPREPKQLQGQSDHHSRGCLLSHPNRSGVQTLPSSSVGLSIYFQLEGGGSGHLVFSAGLNTLRQFRLEIGPFKARPC